MKCDAGFCLNTPTSTLSVNIGTEVYELHFCKGCATALNHQMARQIGATTATVDLYKGGMPYTIGDLQQALEALEATGNG